MPLYEDLVRRAVESNDRATLLYRDARRVRTLARLLREVHAGQATLVRCAWCDSLKVDDEWLHLEAVGNGRQRITAEIRRKASHGICPDCFQQATRDADAQRTYRAARQHRSSG